MTSWHPTTALGYPSVGRNTSGKLLHGGGELLPTSCLILAPASVRRDQATWSVVRFTAPSPGLYRFSGSFESLAMGYGGTSQLILLGARRLSEQALAKFQSEIWEFDLEQDLQPGERVDFMVSASPNGDNASDSTGLSLVVERRKHLSLLWPGLAGLALAGLAALRLRRRPKPPGPRATEISRTNLLR